MISRFLPHPVRRLLGVSASLRPAGYQLIDRPDQLAAFFTALDRTSEVSLDTEADNMFHYRVRVCLLQFLIGKEVFLVDALAPVDLDPLWRRLAKKHLVMHGSDFDLRLLHDRCGFRAHSLFDTMLAAQLLGRQRIGLAALLEHHFGVQLDKNGQKANWSRRPITTKLLDYAALDVWHLPALRDLLTRELARLHRLKWLDQQCLAQIAAGTDGFAPSSENDWRIGKTEKLRGPGLGVMHAIWHWREQQAQRLDTPPFKVCSNELLLRIASPPTADGQRSRNVLKGSISASATTGFSPRSRRRCAPGSSATRTPCRGAREGIPVTHRSPKPRSPASTGSRRTATALRPGSRSSPP